jgi:hypothetical protein
MTALQVIPALCLFLEGLNEEKFWSLPYKLDQVQLKWNQTYEDDFTMNSANIFIYDVRKVVISSWFSKSMWRRRQD